MSGEELARQDAELFGIGFTVDGQRVAPSRVALFQPGRRDPPDPSVACLLADVFWQVGHDGEGPDPSAFKARIFDPMTMDRPVEACADTPAAALRAAVDAREAAAS